MVLNSGKDTSPKKYFKDRILFKPHIQQNAPIDSTPNKEEPTHPIDSNNSISDPLLNHQLIEALSAAREMIQAKAKEIEELKHQADLQIIQAEKITERAERIVTQAKLDSQQKIEQLKKQADQDHSDKISSIVRNLLPLGVLQPEQIALATETTLSFVLAIQKKLYE